MTYNPVKLPSDATPQLIFETVAKHLFKQGDMAVSETGRCSYRGSNGAMCAVGCIIPNDNYVESMEGESVYSFDYKESFNVPSYITDNLGLLSSLQQTHDKTDSWKSSENMRKQLVEVGRRYQLDSNFLAELKFRTK